MLVGMTFFVVTTHRKVGSEVGILTLLDQVLANSVERSKKQLSHASFFVSWLSLPPCALIDSITAAIGTSVAIHANV